jgi:type II secretory pathway pseudopilin PulG
MVQSTPRTETNTDANAGKGTWRGRLTVVEVIAVVVVLGILAAFVVFTVDDASQKGITVACAAEAKAVRTAVDSYRAKHGSKQTPQMTGPNSLLSDHDLLVPSVRWELSYLGTTPMLTAVPDAGCHGTA